MQSLRQEYYIGTVEGNSSDHNPTEIAKGIYVTVHGHFYQPPRENPYLGIIERQSSAHPFSDWNQRIHSECYRPNAFARIFNNQGEVLGIINNYEYLSFNIGATLMSWLENYDLETYQKIIEADRKSSERLAGHGNAIAQVYNHIILPLANKRDKYTQIRWGKADFFSRFGRNVEGMWLAETAVDYPTLEALIDEGIRFIILAPSQAQCCRPFPTEREPEPEWLAVGGGQIDPTRPYRCFIEDGRYIDIFFYDGPISRDMGFNDVLMSSDYFIGRLGQAVRGDHRPAQLISVATDGETFGHHKKDTEKCLAYAFTAEFARRGWQVTNFAHYLSICPPSWEVVLKPITAWSCPHGVGRWQDDCGCAKDEKWHQQWRRPLRDALDWLRDQLIEVYEKVGSQYLRDPWLARDEYIQVILDRSSSNVEEFLQRHQKYPLTGSQQVDALRLLEMQRHSLLMYTSCGWFFEELSRPEGVQILRYASRALELAGEVAGVRLEEEFIRLLSFAPSNLEKYVNGAEIYRQMVTPAQVSFKQVAAHYAITSLFSLHPQEQKIYCYQSLLLDYQKQHIGTSVLAVGQINLRSEITWEEHHFVFAVLHLGGWDFHCCISNFNGRLSYAQVKEQLFHAFSDASAAQTILAMSAAFSGEQFFSLQHLFAEERQRIMQKLTEETKLRLDQLYTQVYRDNYGILMAFQRDDLAVPIELQVAAEIALSHRCAKTIAALEQSNERKKRRLHLAQLKEIARESSHLHCHLQVSEAKKSLERLILHSVLDLFQTPPSDNFEKEIEDVIEMIKVGEALCMDLALKKVQELYYDRLHQEMILNCLEGESECRWSVIQLDSLLQLGQHLQVNLTYRDNFYSKS